MSEENKEEKEEVKKRGRGRAPKADKGEKVRKPRKARTTKQSEATEENKIPAVPENDTLVAKPLADDKGNTQVEKILNAATKVAESIIEDNMNVEEVQERAKVELGEQEKTDHVHRKHFCFIAKYDNIVLERVTLDNLKCVIYECEACNLDEAVEIFRSQLRAKVGGRTSAEKEASIDGLLRKVFGARIIVESYLNEDFSTDTITL